MTCKESQSESREKVIKQVSNLLETLVSRKDYTKKVEKDITLYYIVRIKIVFIMMVVLVGWLVLSPLLLYYNVINQRERSTTNPANYHSDLLFLLVE